MTSVEQYPQVLTDSTNMSDKKETSVTVEQIPSPLASKSPTDQLVPREWPNEPEHLAVSRLYEVAMMMYDLFLCCLTLALVAKTTLCIVSHHINTRWWANLVGGSSPDNPPIDLGSTMTTVLQYVNAQIITAFTIVFVTVMTTATRRFALWKAQRGAYVSDLEQMCGSVSLPSTIKMVFVLRKFTFSSLGLVVLWCFYYLGSQASAREYVRALSGPRHLFQTAISDDTLVFDFAQPSNSSMRSDPFTLLDSTYKVNGWTNTNNGYDMSGLLLVPDMRLKSTTGDGDYVTRSQAEMQEWTSVDNGLFTGTSWSGFAGRKIYIDITGMLGAKGKRDLDWGYLGTAVGSEGVSAIGALIFTTSYVSVECDSVQEMGPNTMPFGTEDTTRTTFNLSAVNTSISSPTYSQRFDVWHKWDQDETCFTQCEDLEKREGVLRVSCSITRPTVEIIASCPAGSCLAERIRYLPTFGSNQFANTTWATAFFEHILRSQGPGYSENYGETNFGMTLETYNIVQKFYNDGNMTQALLSFSYLTTQAFNTYINIAEYEWTAKPGPDVNPTAYRFSTMYGAEYFPQYRLIWPWLAVDYVSTFILLIASITSIWFRKHTLAPDIFGYVSSLTRDNPNVSVIEGGSSLSGIDRARAMEKVKIKIADIGEEGEVGRVGVVSIHENATAQSLSKHRKYV